MRSYNPFSASAGQDVASRVQTILKPFQTAIDHALDNKNFNKALIEFPDFRNEKRWTWKRSEKARRFAWMVSSGSLAPAIVYAYTLLALDHEDQSAKEVSRLSGLPSSDGIVPDLTPEEQRLPRLDTTFDLILFPILKQSFNVCGVDALKNQAWSILEAITAEPTAPSPRRSLDRLLCWRYLSGEVVGVDLSSPEAARQYATMFEGERIRPSEIPAWGKLWVAKRLGKLLALFMDAFDGLRGINDLASVEWVRNAEGIVLLPQTLSRAWTNLLQALSITHVPEATATPLFKAGLYAVATTLMNIFDRDPVAYMPICLLNEEGQSTLSSSAVRLGVVLHLFLIAKDVLGEYALGTVQIESPSQARTQEGDAEGEAFGHPTVAGYLLKHLLRSKLLSQPIDAKARDMFVQLVKSLLEIGSSQNTRMLGHVANAMPWIFDDHEGLQLDVWRTLAMTWTGAVDLQPTDTAAKTNYTGDLLVSLLSCPFRNATVDSVWYRGPAQDVLDAWNVLLKTTVLRFRAKRVGSNFGVLETLAAHFEDFITLSGDEEGTARRLTSATTLSCLAVAMAEVSFVPTEHYHASHFSINENYVPVDFLGFVATALDAAYPSADASAVKQLITTVTTVFRALPADSVSDVLEPLHASVAKWMTDSSQVADADLVQQLDQLYIAILGAVTLAIESGSMAASSETLNHLIDLYAPRLSCAQSAAVPFAFQDFWRRTFQSASGLEHSDDVAGFLHDVLAAVPGLIIVEGLSSDEAVTPSADRFPYAESVPSQIVEPPRVPEDEADDDEYELEAEQEIDLSLGDAAHDAPTPPPSTAPPTTSAEVPTMSADVPTTSADYEADVSQTQDSTGPKTRSWKRKAGEILPASSPEPADGSPDVFGPNKRTKSTKATRRGTGGRSKSHSRLSSISRSSSPVAEYEAGNDTVIAGTDIEDHDAATPSRQIASDVSPEGRESLLASAGRWLRGSLFSPTEHLRDAGEIEHPTPSGKVLDPEREDLADWDESPSVSSLNAKAKATKRRRSRRLDANSQLDSRQSSVAVEEAPAAAQTAVPVTQAEPAEEVNEAPKQVVEDVAKPAEAVKPVAAKQRDLRGARSMPLRATRSASARQSSLPVEASRPLPQSSPATQASQPSSQPRRSRRQANRSPEASVEDSQVDIAAELPTAPSKQLVEPTPAAPVEEPTPAQPTVELMAAQPIEELPAQPMEQPTTAPAPAQPVVVATPSQPPIAAATPSQPSPPATRSSARRKRISESQEIPTAPTSKRLRSSDNLTAAAQPQPQPTERRESARAARRERRQREEPVTTAEAPAEPMPGAELPAVADVEMAPAPGAQDEMDAEVPPPAVETIQADLQESEESVEPEPHADAQQPEVEVEPELPAPTDAQDPEIKPEAGRVHFDLPADANENDDSHDSHEHQHEPSHEHEDDDARNATPPPSSDVPAPNTTPPTPTRRTAAQSRLLTLLSEAAQDESAVSELDFDGVVELLSNVERLRALATANLQAQALEARALRRSRTM